MEMPLLLKMVSLVHLYSLTKPTARLSLLFGYDAKFRIEFLLRHFFSFQTCFHLFTPSSLFLFCVDFVWISVIISLIWQSIFTPHSLPPALSIIPISVTYNPITQPMNHRKELTLQKSHLSDPVNTLNHLLPLLLLLPLPTLIHSNYSILIPLIDSTVHMSSK